MTYYTNHNATISVILSLPFPIIDIIIGGGEIYPQTLCYILKC